MNFVEILSEDQKCKKYLKLTLKVDDEFDDTYQWQVLIFDGTNLLFKRLELMSQTNFRVTQLRYTEMDHFDWLKLDTCNSQSEYFFSAQHTYTKYSKICLWHWLQVKTYLSRHWLGSFRPGKWCNFNHRADCRAVVAVDTKNVLKSPAAFHINGIEQFAAQSVAIWIDALIKNLTST